MHMYRKQESSVVYAAKKRFHGHSNWPLNNLLLILLRTTVEYAYFMDVILFALYVWNLMMQCAVYAVLPVLFH